MAQGPDLIDVKEIARMFGVTERTVWRWADSNPKFPQRMMLGPRTIRFRRKSVEKYIGRTAVRDNMKKRCYLKESHKKSGLRIRHREFVKSYSKNPNAMRAAIDAGYSPRSAHVTGSRLLKKCEIKKLIISSREKDESERTIEKRRVLKWLRAYIDADIAEVFDDLNNIKPIKNWPLILRSSGINIKIRNSNDGEVKYIETYKKNIMKCIELYGQHDFVRAYEAPNTRCPGKNRNIDRWILGLMGALEFESDSATNLNRV